MENPLNDMGRKAKAAARILSACEAGRKASALRRLAALLEREEAALLAANAEDMDAARAAGLDAPRLDRLRLDSDIVSGMAAACRHVAALPDPVGAMVSQWQRPGGLLVGRMRVPLGVIAMIYEARPNVTIDASILCLKAGNAVILRGGSEAFRSNQALAALLHWALKEEGLPEDCVQLLPGTDRALITALCKLDRYVDVIIPRGGEGLIRMVSEQASMPVLKHDKGVCHAFIDESADLPQAAVVARNSKVQRPAACNALECLLVHEAVAAEFLPLLARELNGDAELRACHRALPLLEYERLLPLAEDDLGREFHDYILAVKVVKGLDEALAHIARYGSNHTEIICTNNHAHAMRFLREADASMVAVNASTRFNDGEQLGLGAEIGISTSKLHAYGPMGVEELTTTKFVVLGQGQIRPDAGCAC